MKPVSTILILILITLVIGCNPAQPAGTPAQLIPTGTQAKPTNVLTDASRTPLAVKNEPTPTRDEKTTSETAPPETGTETLPAGTSPAPPAIPKATFTARPKPTLAPYEWKLMPVVPKVSDAIVDILQRGLELGNNPRAFSKIGDCGSTPAWFLGDFDRGPEYYNLGEYQELEAVIQEFQGSFGRTSLAARSGYNASSLFVPLWADRAYCQSDETPLACEYREHKPVIAYIMLGANDVWHPEEFEPQMRKIIEFSIESGIIPILSTKADNQEGDDSINATIAQLAWEYEIPMWNFWLAAQSLPNHGLQEDEVHLTWGRSFFDDPAAMDKAWPVRNLTALQILDAVWRVTTAESK